MLAERQRLQKYAAPISSEFPPEEPLQMMSIWYYIVINIETKDIHERMRSSENAIEYLI